MSIVRIYTGTDNASHFEDIELRLEARGDQSESAELLPGTGILVRRFEQLSRLPLDRLAEGILPIGDFSRIVPGMIEAAGRFIRGASSS